MNIPPAQHHLQGRGDGGLSEEQILLGQHPAPDVFGRGKEISGGGDRLPAPSVCFSP